MNGKRILFAAVIAASIAITGCGNNLSGKYEAEGGMMSVEFKGSKAYLTALGTTTESEYEVNGDKVTFKNGGEKGGNLVMTIEKDGSLSGPLGMKLKKKA
jgi:hypothetical protein